MAILRGGRRIGNFDIRVGLPRDRSLVDVAADPRLKRQPGGAGTIQRFLAQVNTGEGFARTNRYIVRINPPARVFDNPYAGDFDMSPGNNDLESLTTIENVDMMCNKVTMPNRDVNTATNRTYGPARRMPYAYSYSGELELSFYGDKFLRQRMFFENWQKKIFDIQTHNMNYYDSYVGSMDIMQLGQFDSKQDDDARVTYAVRLFEVYPQTIGSYDYTYGSENEQVIVPITLNFRTWANLTIDQINGATVGKSVGDVPAIKASKDFGLFSGVLGKLPPEFRRAGRDVLETATYELTLPSSDVQVKYRPFLVKEEKVLLLAMESEDGKQITSALKDIVRACTFNSVNVEALPTFDLEYIFLNIRAKSVGEVTKLKLLCPDDKETYANVELDLSKVEVQVDDKHTNEVVVNDKIKMRLAYPTIDTFDPEQDAKTLKTQALFDVIGNVVYEIYEGETVHKASDYTKEEMQTFLESLSTDVFVKIQNFFNTMPRLQHEVEVENPKTKVKSKIMLSGLQS